MIKTLRAEKGLTQSQLAKEVGVSPGNIGDWEIGRSKPGYIALAALSQYFGVSSDYLLGLTSKPNHERMDAPICDGEPLTEAESDLVAMFRLLDSKDQENAFDFVTLLYGKTTGEKGSVYSTYSNTKKQQESNTVEDEKSGSIGEQKSRHETA
ncbi:helix-turn-helix domain-containing protein [Anaerotignum sp.]|uniref:helix-turn-helix domain-containing protein n=1 Tax=Anaerotignum sp. TaxID=2039241 RepID=UPI00289B0DAB|nr:helix-turn-helix transcriptional regulator [Anaerotignum sp.]